ncbi:MAG: hypothetical protein LUD17_05160 [Bacteroidales bacterium]|nr:hypothetical protein [Bacteroidales bacterium]
MSLTEYFKEQEENQQKLYKMQDILRDVMKAVSANPKAVADSFNPNNKKLAISETTLSCGSRVVGLHVSYGYLWCDTPYGTSFEAQRSFCGLDRDVAIEDAKKLLEAAKAA